MLNDTDMRKFIVVLWTIAFLLLWGGFYLLLPEKALIREIDKMEKSIVKEDWDSAQKQLDDFKKTYYDKKILIQSNNATEAFINFNNNLGQLDYCIRNKEPSALEYLGALKFSLDYSVKGFSGP